MERITYSCIKKEKGSCKGCPAFRHMLRLSKLNVPYQHVLNVAKRECVYGPEPSVETTIDENGGTKVIFEGYKIK